MWDWKRIWLSQRKFANGFWTKYRLLPAKNHSMILQKWSQKAILWRWGWASSPRSRSHVPVIYGTREPHKNFENNIRKWIEKNKAEIVLTTTQICSSLTWLLCIRIKALKVLRESSINSLLFSTFILKACLTALYGRYDYVILS